MSAYRRFVTSAAVSPDRRDFARGLFALCAAGALPLLPGTAAANPMREGIDWAPIVPAQRGESPGKIEVLEFFSYACPHCRDFHPLITRWAAALPKDVVFKRVPVTFGRAAWNPIARLFHALEATGDLERLDQAVFDAIHKQRVSLYTDKEVLAWIGGQGVDGKRFADAYNGFSTQTKVARDEQRTRAYKVDGVPRIAVDGRYSVLGKEVRELSGLLVIADRLIARARAERKSG